MDLEFVAMGPRIVRIVHHHSLKIKCNNEEDVAQNKFNIMWRFVVACYNVCFAPDVSTT